MDEKGRMGIRNWNFSEQTVGLPVADSASEHQAAFLKMSTYKNRNSIIREAEAESSGMEFGNHVWVHPRNFLPAIKTSPNTLQSTQINTETGLPVVPTGLALPIDQPTANGEVKTKTSKTRKQSSKKKSDGAASKALKPKLPKRKSEKKEDSASTAKREKKNLDIVIDGTTVDFSQVPTPVCSCTGGPRQCYRWGAGGWQSSCCTTSVSEYPLPMSSSRPGSRMAGRKMSNGAYGKLLQRLATEGYDLSNAVDLKDHWARHGTNKFVTIK